MNLPSDSVIRKVNLLYRFFYHFRKSLNGMTVHFKGKCVACKNVKCKVACETKWRKTQPYLVMQGFCKEVIVVDDIATIK